MGILNPEVRPIINHLPLAALLCAIAAAAPMVHARTPQAFRSLKEIREQGVVMQQWETSCAAAAVATVLTYGFNDPVSERLAASRMLEQTDPTKVKRRGGFSLLDLKRFVEGRGYQGSAYQHLGFDDLRVFHAPIVAIDQHGYNHYVVFNGVTGDQVLLADPAFGNRIVSIAGFTAIWIDGLAFVVTRPPPP
ncbi:cysteine peptidase family C39 domain-containing protein [uncultured Thiodictyon sp.]|uniref:C39 family peptidase n=1 Tax=uncultured Thiodictyon sp. TaxID=1846217 RepID=UPI0025DA0BE9|nr:cysteine peptidase family C39 domain-containing protein [uncultured Thiodictyon sp.]